MEYPSKSILSHRETEVLKLIVCEQSSEQIAFELGISRRTVETHRQHIAQKLGTTSLIAFVKYAIKMGWITDYHFDS